MKVWSGSKEVGKEERKEYKKNKLMLLEEKDNYDEGKIRGVKRTCGKKGKGRDENMKWK